MKIAIIGPGALGCLLTAKLSLKSSKSPHELWLLDHNPPRASHLTKNGLTLEENDNLVKCKVHVTTNPGDLKNTDFIFLCVKSHDVLKCLEMMNKFSSPDTLLITLQNGIDHLKHLHSVSGNISVALGVTAQGANLVAPGHVVHAGSGPTRIGFADQEPEGALKRLNEATDLLNSAELETKIVENILDHIWSKFFVNIGINALTAIHNCPNGQLLQSAAIVKKMETAVQEAVAVANACNIQIMSDPVTTTKEICKSTGRNISSMLQDVRNERPTEIDSINGALVEKARELGIDTPMNQELVAEVKKIERNYLH